MPDRAVVEDEMCPYCEARQMAGHGFPSPECPTCDKTGYVPVITNGTVRTRDGQQIWPQRRAIVALSEDRQWLVVLEPDIEGHPEATSAFGVWKRDIRAGWVLQAAIIDTGQDAHDVLAEWMAGQG